MLNKTDQAALFIAKAIRKNVRYYPYEIIERSNKFNHDSTIAKSAFYSALAKYKNKGVFDYYQVDGSYRLLIYKGEWQRMIRQESTNTSVNSLDIQVEEVTKKTTIERLEKRVADLEAKLEKMALSLCAAGRHIEAAFN